MKAVFAAAALAVCMAAPPAAAETETSATPITVGEELQIHSAVLGQERELAVYLPPEYAADGKAYPVLYLIDGGVGQDFLHVAGTSTLNAIWGRSQPVIVVGVETLDRRAELIGETASATLREEYPTAGNAAAFRRYIADEVMPLVEARYRTDGTRGVIGESLAGLFIVESALLQPDLFQRHAAISPSLWWDDAALAGKSAALLEQQLTVPHLYLALGSEGEEMQAGFDGLVSALTARQAPSEQGWCAIERADLRHSTTYHALSPQALQFLFPVPLDGEEPMEGFEPPCVVAEDSAP